MVISLINMYDTPDIAVAGAKLMRRALSYLWAKTPIDGTEGIYHPLILHMLDSAACASALMKREPRSTADMMATALNVDIEELSSLLAFITGCHDIGKAAPGFQAKWPAFVETAKTEGIYMPSNPDLSLNHAYLSQMMLEKELPSIGWDTGRARLFSYAVGCHHGLRPSFLEINLLESNRNAIGDQSWSETRKDLLRDLSALFGIIPPTLEYNQNPDGADFAMLAGLITIADWMASDSAVFSYGTADDCLDIESWYQKRRLLAETALDQVGWNVKLPLVDKPFSFSDIFSRYSPRPLQSAMAKAVSSAENPSAYVVEAPMGEGKTEAALFAYLALQARFGHRGLYVAMPTRATGNAMFSRVHEFLEDLKVDRPVELQLVHGTVMKEVPQSHIETFSDNGKNHPSITSGTDIEASEWFGSKKKALLSENGVGTIDQALMSVLNIRHNYLRMWGLANKVVVFDEVHAYDAYTGTLLLELIRWLNSLNSPVVILSATLPKRFRSELASAIGHDEPIKESDSHNAKYPRITVMDRHNVRELSFPFDKSLSRKISITGASIDVDEPKLITDRYMPNDGMAAVILNTVDRAQAVYRAWGEGAPIVQDGEVIGKALGDGTEVYLFHARYPSESRMIRERNALGIFASGNDKREGRRVIVATQVIEQSLDLDFDIMFTDLAPIDLILQRAGRLWRKPRTKRPFGAPSLYVAGLGERLIDFGKPLWWGAVYREDVLIKTWALLKRRDSIRLPSDIDVMVQAVYGDDVSILDGITDAERKRYATAESECYGELSAMRCSAKNSTIGKPDDGSWEAPSNLILLDEDAAGIHQTLIAKTRSSDRSVSAIPMGPDSLQLLTHAADSQSIRELVGRSINISRRSHVGKLEKEGVPEEWKKRPLLRSCYPMKLDQEGRWELDKAVKLDSELGLVYGQEG